MNNEGIGNEELANENPPILRPDQRLAVAESKFGTIMTPRNLRIASSGLAIASLVLVAIGTHLRETAPRFDEWLRSSVPGGNPGSLLAVWWVPVTVGWVILFGFLFGAIAALVALRTSLTKKRWLVVSFRAGILTALILIAVLVSWGAFGDFRWGFTLLAVGESAAAAAVIVGDASTLKQRNPQGGASGKAKGATHSLVRF